VTIEEAYANTNKTMNEAEAVQSTIEAVVRKKADALKYMHEQIGFDNDQIMKYLQTTLIKDYDGDSRVGVHLDDL
jgi:hypothetical protein